MRANTRQQSAIIGAQVAEANAAKKRRGWHLTHARNWQARTSRGGKAKKGATNQPGDSWWVKLSPSAFYATAKAKADQRAVEDASRSYRIGTEMR